MRPQWDEYMMNIAKAVSSRATCDRLHVGCVIANSDHHILSTGYNGAVSGGRHCDDAGHLMLKGHCVRTVHAEQNAITQAARRGVSLLGSTAYVTALPCVHCIKLIISSGVERVTYGAVYGDCETVEVVNALALEQGVKLERFMQ